MANRIARVWSGSEWESVSSPATPANSVVYYQSDAPSSPVTGQLWADSDNNTLSVWTGSSWQSVSSDLTSYATISYVSNANNLPNFSSAKVPTVSLNSQPNSYSLVSSDAGKMIYFTNSTSASLTIPLNSSVAFATGTRIDVVQAGNGEVTISGASGVTVNSEGNKNKILDRWCAATIIKTDTDAWMILGALKV